MLRDDVENSGARYSFGMIEAHAMQHACAAIVTGGIETLMAKRRHDLDLVRRHCAKRIIRMIGAARRLLGIAVAAQIGRHYREFFRQVRRKFMPRQMTERVAVHE